MFLKIFHDAIHRVSLQNSECQNQLLDGWEKEEGVNIKICEENRINHIKNKLYII